MLPPPIHPAIQKKAQMNSGEPLTKPISLMLCVCVGGGFFGRWSCRGLWNLGKLKTHRSNALTRIQVYTYCPFWSLNYVHNTCIGPTVLGSPGFCMPRRQTALGLRCCLVTTYLEVPTGCGLLAVNAGTWTKIGWNREGPNT